MSTTPTTQPSAGSNGLLADLELVNRQMLCVIHFAGQVQQLYTDLQKLLPTLAATPGGHHMIKMQGDRANQFMQWVGDFLGGQDAITEVDEAYNPVIKQAAERWKNILAELNASHG